MGTKPSPRKVVYKRVGPNPFEVIGEIVYEKYRTRSGETKMRKVRK